MTIEDAETVDGVGISKADGAATLVISDHLAWFDERLHLRALERKVNHYIDFVRSGQFVENLPEALGRPVRISLICKFEPSSTVLNALLELRNQLRSAGIDFTFGLLPHDY